MALAVRGIFRVGPRIKARRKDRCTPDHHVQHQKFKARFILLMQKMVRTHCTTDFIRKLSLPPYSSSCVILHTLKTFSLCSAHSLLGSMQTYETSRHFISLLTHYLQLLSSAALLDFFWIVFYFACQSSAFLQTVQEDSVSPPEIALPSPQMT